MQLSGLYCAEVLLPTGWAQRVALVFDALGTIQTVRLDAAPGDLPCAAGPVVPGVPNLHSHAFQRALAGLTERAGPGEDSFWTWRQAMYEFVAKLTPDRVTAIATQLYIDLLKHGYTTVAEFHYLHHDSNGAPYAQRSELSRRVIDAALAVGIGITCLPALYAYGGFGAQAPAPSQRRFINDAAGLMVILDELAGAYRGQPQVRLGLALHSLRALSPALLQDVLALYAQVDQTAPLHIHIAEQQREVEDCLAWSGRRPVEWLLDHAPVDACWCLVHATHMTPTETTRLAASGAVVGLCPTTEANLGDGFFPAADYIKAGGRFGIGSDSHVGISPAEELRTLEYGQRLLRQQRNVLRLGEQAAIGAGLYRAVLAGGAQALGRPLGGIAPGQRADLVVLDNDRPLLYGKDGDALLDAWVFCGGRELVRDVIVGGRQVISQGHHALDEASAAGYRRALTIC